MEATLLESVFPQDTNPQGNLFGGQLVAWMDRAAGYAAIRRSRRPVVTATIENISFDVPIHKGEMVELHAKVVSVGRSSMRVRVEVFVEDPASGDQKLVTVGHFVMVALGPDGRPTPVPPEVAAA